MAGVVLLLCGCSPGQPAPAVHAGAPEVALPAREGTLSEVAGRYGSPESLWIEASYKIRREQGRITKTLAIEIEHATPGTTLELVLDGFVLGKLITSSKGKGDFELIQDGDNLFPDGFVEPHDGSRVRVGTLAEFVLGTVEKLTDLQLEADGPEPLKGKVSYKIERLGDAVTREFQVKVTSAPVKTVHPIVVDGVHVADLNVDLAGKGKVLFSTLKGTPFPSDFHAPEAGSVVQVGELFRGTLRDNRQGGE